MVSVLNNTFNGCIYALAVLTSPRLRIICLRRVRLCVSLAVFSTPSLLSSIALMALPALYSSIASLALVSRYAGSQELCQWLKPFHCTRYCSCLRTVRLPFIASTSHSSTLSVSSINVGGGGASLPSSSAKDDKRG